MSIFNKRRGRATPTTVRRTTVAPARRPERRLEHHPPAVSPDQALRRIHAAADQAREEIAALVQAEHAAIDRTIAAASGDTEERLRGATERRIDLEMKRLDEAGNKLRRDLKKMIRVEVAKVAKNPPAETSSSDIRSVPIRARA